MIVALTAAAAVFASAADHVRVPVPAGASVSRRLDGRSLMAAGWRLVWDGRPVGPGRGVVRLTIAAVPADGVGAVDEMLQVGVGGAGTARTCLTYGMAAASERLPDRTIGGRRWAVWRNGGAGMSQQVAATELRTVWRGRCYAVARVSYAVKAMDAAQGLPGQRAAAAAMDRALMEVRLE